MADDAIDHLIKIVEGLLVAQARVVREEIVNCQHDLGAAPLAKQDEPEIERQTLGQHGEELHVNDVGRGDDEAHRQCGEIEQRFEELQNSSWQAG